MDAIRVGHLSARGGHAPLLRRLLLPGRGWRHIPVRNLLRTPRRSALTALGIAAAITTLVTTVGFLDTFNATLDRSQTELLRTAPDRITVALRQLEPESGDVVARIRALPQVASASTAVAIAATAHTPGHSVDLLTETLPDGGGWTPSIVDGTRSGGIVLAEKAARLLLVAVREGVVPAADRASLCAYRSIGAARPRPTPPA